MIDTYSNFSRDNIKPGRRTLLIAILAIILGVAVAITVNAVGILSLIAIIGLFLAISTLTNPDLGLMMFIFIIYINLSSVLISNYGLPSIAKPLVVFMGGLIILRGALFKDEYQGWIMPTILLGLYSLLGSISLAYASDFNLALTTLIDYLKDAIIAIIIIMLIQKPFSLRKAIWTLLLTGIFMGTISVYQQVTGNFSNTFGGFATVTINSTSGTRSAGPIGDPNFYAQIMVLLIPIAIDRVWNEKSLFLKGLAVWAFFVISLTVVYTFSRGAFLALISSFIFMAIKRPPRLPTALLGVAAFLIVFQFVPITYKARIESIFNIFPSTQTTGTVDRSFQGRTSENLVAWNIFLDHPILGVGLGNYNVYYLEYSRKLGIDSRVQDRSAHNLYLETAAERGIFGLSLFAIIIFLTLRQAFQTEQKFKELGNKSFADMAAALGISVFTYLITAIFLHDAFPRFFWLIVGLAWSLPQSGNYLSSLVGRKTITL